ncbi:MAG: D-cysteine desulfhydrase [Phycisphaeraceae bacterium]|nr:D-cysteine desulfhydrase [Phycisphaeraceae bacterium]
MDLDSYPRRRYTKDPTPLHALPRFSEALGGPTVHIKRDDLLGLAGGGNKTRKLEFVVAEALAEGCDTLITCGATQSNHCRLTASAAALEGVRCRLALEQRAPNIYDAEASGNNLLYRALDVERFEICDDGSDMDEVMHRMAAEARDEGRRPHVIPLGAGSPRGVLGYIECLREILAQARVQDVRFDAIVTAAGGTGGTQAGLLVGLLDSGDATPVIGINSGADRATEERRVFDLARRTIEFSHLSATLDVQQVECLDAYVGDGYAQPTAAMIEAVQRLARTEGVLLDPVYSGKAMAGLIDLVRQGRFRRDRHVLFLHTGGVPALYHYAAPFLSKETT